MGAGIRGIGVQELGMLSRSVCMLLPAFMKPSEHEKPLQMPLLSEALCSRYRLTQAFKSPPGYPKLSHDKRKCKSHAGFLPSRRLHVALWQIHRAQSLDIVAP